MTMLDELAPWRLEQVWTERDQEPQIVEGYGGVCVTDFYPDSDAWALSVEACRWITTSGHIRFKVRWTGECPRIFPLMLMVNFTHMPRISQHGVPLEEPQGRVAVGLSGLIVESGIYEVFPHNQDRFNGSHAWAVFPTFFSLDDFVGATTSEIAKARLKGPLAHPVAKGKATLGAGEGVDDD